MKNWIVVAAVLLSASAAEASLPEAAPAARDWQLWQVRDGVALLYLPLTVTLDDYPRQARRAGEEGTSILNLEVGTSGIRACSTAQSSGSPVLDEQACRLYRERGRFELRGTSEPVIIQAPVQWVLMD